MAGVDGSEDERLTFTQQPDYDALFGKQANKQQRFVQNTVLGEVSCVVGQPQVLSLAIN